MGTLLKILLNGESETVEFKSNFNIETVLNMIVHRDYRSASDSIVKIFDTKIESYNPGRLTENITIDDLLLNNYTSTPRNKLIADFFKSMGLIEKYGSGIKRIVDYFMEENLPKPSFKNISEGFMVTIYSEVYQADIINVTEKRLHEGVSEGVNEGVSEGVNELLNLVNKFPGERIPYYAAVMKTPLKTLERWAKELREKNTIEFIGASKTGGYYLKNSNSKN